MGIIAERRKASQESNFNVRLMRLLRLYEDDIPVIEIARMEKVSRSRIYQLLTIALERRQDGTNGT